MVKGLLKAMLVSAGIAAIAFVAVYSMLLIPTNRNVTQDTTNQQISSLLQTNALVRAHLGEVLEVTVRRAGSFVETSSAGKRGRTYFRVAGTQERSTIVGVYWSVSPASTNVFIERIVETAPFKQEEVLFQSNQRPQDGSE
jgi:hypothetical protein